MDQFERLSLRIEGGAFAVDSRRQVVFWNQACERLLGVSARAALGQPCFHVIRANGASGGRYCSKRCTLATLVRGGAAPEPMPLWLSAADGVPQPLSVSVFLIPSPQQGRWHVMHVLTEVQHTNGTQSGDLATAARNDVSTALTPRETEVLQLLAQGHCTAEIASRLYLSPVTVRNHVQHLTGKLGLHSQLEAVAYAYRNDLVARSPRREMAPPQIAAVTAS